MIGKLKQFRLPFMILPVLLIMGFSVPALAQAQEEDGGMGFAVFANLETNSIQFIDPATMTVSDSYLKGMLGSYEGGLLDVAVTSDGKTAIVSNFGDWRIFAIDISGGFGVEPVLLGSQFVHFPPEDLAITPDDKYVMITDGEESPAIAVIEIASMRFVLLRYLPGDCECGYNAAESIAIAPDGQTVLVTDFWAGAVHTLLWNKETEDLRYANTYWVLPFWPVNISISPDGKTVVVPMAYHSRTVAFTIEAPGVLAYHGTVNLPASEGQSAVFSKDGSKLYYHTNDPWQTGTQVHIYDVTAPGQLSFTGTSIQVKPFRGPDGFFGVDVMALDATGNYLLTTNSTDIEAYPFVSVLDLGTNTQVTKLRTNGIPVGIAFSYPQTPEEDPKEESEK
jgi:DNA-binding beta-propeller fold protein YncE